MISLHKLERADSDLLMYAAAIFNVFFRHSPISAALYLMLIIYSCSTQ